jgi:pimeloyl-ACP methyl ester carboxylesterase
LPVDVAFLDSIRQEASSIPAATWATLLADMSALDLAGAAANIDIPVLSISGGRDPLFGQDDQIELAAAFDDCQRVWLPDNGHNLHWESPSVIANLIKRFAMAKRLGAEKP